MPTTTQLRPPSPADVRELLGQPNGPWASIYLGLPERPGFDDLGQVPLRFRQAVERAVERMRALGFEEEARTPEAWLESLDVEARSVPRPARGLAAFLGPGDVRAWAVPGAVADRVAVGRSQRVRPLLQALHAGGTYRLFTVSANHVQIFEGDSGGLRAVEDAHVPVSLHDAIGEVLEKREDMQFHSSARGGLAPVFHGQGGSDLGREIDLEKFHTVLAHASAKVWADRTDPLVLAADASHQGRFRKHAKLRGLLSEGLEGSFDRTPAEELHRKAWSLVQEWRAREDRRLIEEFDRLRGGPRVVWELEPAVEAALSNRVWRVWLDPDREEPRHVDRKTGELVAAIGDEDAYDELAAIVVARGGEAIVVRPGLLPQDAPLAAELRG